MYKITENDIKMCNYFTRRFLLSWGVPITEDLIQEGYLVMCGVAKDYKKERGHFLAFLHTCIKNNIQRQAYFYTKHNKRRKSCALMGGGIVYIDEESTNFLHLVLHHKSEIDNNTNDLIENKDLINKTLRTMYPIVAKAIVDKFFWDIDYKETAIKSGRKGNYIRATLSNWRKKKEWYVLDTAKRQEKFWGKEPVDFIKLAEMEV